MKQYQIVEAYTKLEQLSSINDFHVEEHKKIFILRKQLRPHVEFHNERLSALADKYRPFANENGILEGDHYKKYMEEINELNNTEIEDQFKKITLPVVEGITFLTMEELEDFIDFV